MNLQEFNQTGRQRITKINKMLQEQYGVSVKSKILSKKKLQRIAENANQQVIRLRSTNKKFHLDPDYAKFLGIRDVIETMIAEGQYAESPKYLEMKREVNETVRELMDSGYTQEEACTETMNRFRRDSRFAYDDDHVRPIVIQCARRYAVECGGSEGASAGLNERVLAELANREGIRLENVSSCTTVEDKIQEYAAACGKSAEAIVEFLNQQPESSMAEAIDMLDGKCKEARQAQTAQDINTMETRRNKRTAINENVDIEQAEVVIAARSLASDIQDQVERLGRMVNEEIPAIVDQMTQEMGAQTAQAFNTQALEVLNGHLEAARSAKTAMDNAIAGVTGGETIDNTDMNADVDSDDLDLDLDLDGDDDDLGLDGTDELDDLDDLDVDNTDADAGTPGEPLGRAGV